MKTEAWAYDVVKLFHDIHFTNVITEAHLKEVRAFDELKGWIAVKEKEKYLLPELVEGEDIRKILPLRIKETVDHKQGTAIYRVVKNLQRFSIPAKRTMSFRAWVDAFAPFAHSNPKEFKLYKVLTLGALISRFHYRIASNPAFGKDSLPLLLSQILPMEASVYFPRTNARLMHMLERRLLVITEIPDAAKTDMKLLEPVIRIAGDMRPTLKNSAMAMSGMTKDEYDISQLSMGFIYNEIDDYRVPKLKEDRSDHYFDNYFTAATQERFFPLHLSGTLDTQQFRNIDTKATFEAVHDSLKIWVMSAQWFMRESEPLSQAQQSWPSFVFTGIPLEKGRLYTHLLAMTEVFRLYAQTQEEFFELCQTLQDCYHKYQSMINKEVEVKVVEESI